MTLFDLGKAFDLLVRADAWKAVGRLTEDASIEFFLEELHRGVCYILKDKHTGQLRKRTGDRTAITAQQQGMNTEVNVSDLEFMDDLVSFFEFQELGTLQRFIECVAAIFTQHSFQVNVGKLEVCVLWWRVQGPSVPVESGTVEAGTCAHPPERRSRAPS